MLLPASGSVMAKTRMRLAGDDARHDVALLLLGAVLEDAGGVHRRYEHERGREPERADVLERQRQRDQPGVVAAVLLRHERAEQADVRELLPQLVVELVVAMRHLAPLFLLVLVPGEHLAHGAAQELVFFGESGSLSGSCSLVVVYGAKLTAPWTPQWPSCLLTM